MNRGSEPRLSEAEKKLFEAAKSGDYEKVKSAASGVEDFDVVDDLNYTPLCWLVRRGEVKSAEFLIKKGANVKYVEEQRGDNLFHLAAGFCSNLDMFTSLLRHHVDMNLVNRDHKTPLHEAAQREDTKIANWFLHNHVLPSVNSFGQTAFCFAAWQSEVPMLQLLHASGLFFLEHRAYCGTTPALWAAWGGRRDNLRFLADQKANLAHRNDGGNTALHLAAMWGHLDAVRYLMVRPEVEKNSPNNFGYSPVELAAINNCTNVVDEFRKHNININTQKITQAKADLEQLHTSGSDLLQRSNYLAAGEKYRALYYCASKLYRDVMPTLKEIDKHLQQRLSMQVPSQSASSPALSDTVIVAAAASAAASPASSPATPKYKVSEQGEVTIQLAIPHGALKREVEIGKGAFGRVYKGRLFRERVAIKTITHKDEKAVEAFRAEASIMAKLQASKYTVRLHGISSDPDTRDLILVMEFMQGGGLDRYLQDAKNILTTYLVLKFAHQIANALAYLHRNGIVHSDLKSPNVLLDKSKTHAKVTDFGVSKVRARDLDCTKTVMGPSFAGSPYWMAPELMTGEGKTNPGTDTYSFGLLMWELLGREIPFKKLPMGLLFTKIPAGERPQIPANTLPAYEALMKRCWATDSKNRPTMDTVVDELKTMRLEEKANRHRP